MIGYSYIGKSTAVFSLIAVMSVFVISCGGKTPEPAPESVTPAAERHMSAAELRAMPKIDAHVHINGATDEEFPPLFECLDSYNMQWLTICVAGVGPKDRLEKKIQYTGRVHGLYPNRVTWATTFGLSDWGKPGWEQEAEQTILDGFSKGAVGVKVWKAIGMTLKDPDSSYVMIDDERFDPIFDLIASNNKTLIAHIGEPRNCWMPLDSMTVNNDRLYFKDNPKYHSYLHPEIPNYWEHIAARDSVLAHHPNLRMVGCHLGSLEFDVDELAKRFDKYPNFAVDLAARVCHLQVQDREKVRNFLIKYQDRVLYGTDLGAGRAYMRTSIDSTITRIETTYDNDLRYFATSDEMEVWEVNGKFRGLELPADVLRKIFHDNAVKWFPGIF